MSQTIISRQSCPRNASITVLITKWLLLVTLVSAVVLTSPGNKAEASPNVRLCGNKLVKMVTALCKGCLQGTRIDPVLKRGSVSLESLDEFTGKNSHWSHGHGYMDTVFGNRQRRDGIATECCERMCSYSYLKSFCCDAA